MVTIAPSLPNITPVADPSDHALCFNDYEEWDDSDDECQGMIALATTSEPMLAGNHEVTSNDIPINIIISLQKRDDTTYFGVPLKDFYAYALSLTDNIDGHFLRTQSPLIREKLKSWVNHRFFLDSDSLLRIR